MARGDPPATTGAATGDPAGGAHHRHPAGDRYQRQLRQGFNDAEAATLLAQCTHINKSGEYPYDITGWTPVWPATDRGVARIGPCQHAWMLWEKIGEPNTDAVVTRATISKEPSIIEEQPVIRRRLAAR